jgi:hypothetical protein
MNKKIIFLSTPILFALLLSCNNEPATKREVITVPVSVPVEKKEVARPTSITVDKGGVQVETKKVNVKVKPN